MSNESPRLVLASTSRYRRELLSRLGVAFEAYAPRCDEEALKAELDDELPDYVAATLARAKAESLASHFPGAYVIGSDQLVDLDGEVLGKPGTEELCVAQLMSMRGLSHRLLTAIALVRPDGQVIEHVDVHTLVMRDLDEEEIRRYVAREKPIDCAGSYKIEQGGIALFERIDGHDFTAITGLPLVYLTTLLRDEGFSIP